MEEGASMKRSYNMIKIRMRHIKTDRRTKIEHPEIEMYVCVYVCITIKQASKIN